MSDRDDRIKYGNNYVIKPRRVVVAESAGSAVGYIALTIGVVILAAFLLSLVVGGS